MTGLERHWLEEELKARRKQYHRCRTSPAAQRIIAEIIRLLKLLEQ